jgi:uncharacterized protein (DUF2062 family)
MFIRGGVLTKESHVEVWTKAASRLFQRKVISPVIHLLRVGASPRKLAWSLAVGVAVGINPLLGTTTVLCLAVAFVLRLNLVASQITNHLVYPLQLAMFFVFLNAGDKVFHTGALPLSKEAMLSGMRHHPLETTRLLWSWEWHALAVWGVCAVVGTPLLVGVLTPVLRKLLMTMQETTS